MSFSCLTAYFAELCINIHDCVDYEENAAAKTCSKVFNVPDLEHTEPWLIFNLLTAH